MKNQRAMRLSAQSQEAKPLAERGRMLFVRDVQALFGTKPDGAFRKSTWWVRTQFAPEQKHKLGRDPYWWESDVTAWLDKEAAA